MNITDDLASPVQLQLERTVRELEREAAFVLVLLLIGSVLLWWFVLR